MESYQNESLGAETSFQSQAFGFADTITECRAELVPEMAETLDWQGRRRESRVYARAIADSAKNRRVTTRRGTRVSRMPLRAQGLSIRGFSFSLFR